MHVLFVQYFAGAVASQEAWFCVVGSLALGSLCQEFAHANLPLLPVASVLFRRFGWVHLPVTLLQTEKYLMAVADVPEYIAGIPGFYKAGLTSAMPRKWWSLCSTLSNVQRFNAFTWNFFLCRFILLHRFAKCFCFNWLSSPFCSLHSMPEMEPHLCWCGNNAKTEVTESG